MGRNKLGDVECGAKEIKNSILGIYEMPDRHVCRNCPMCEFSSLCFMENLSRKLILLEEWLNILWHYIVVMLATYTFPPY